MNFYLGFDYAKGYYLKFQSEGRILEFRCCVFSNLENDDEKQHSFLRKDFSIQRNRIPLRGNEVGKKANP